MHISGVSAKESYWFFRPFFWWQQRKYGKALEPATVWARVAQLYWVLMAFYAVLERRASPIPPGLRSLLQTYISQLNHCQFCVDLNAANAAERLGSLDKVMAVGDWEQSDAFDKRERAYLDYARAITLSDRQVDGSMVERLRRHTSERGVIELTALIAFQNMSSKFNAALDIESMGLCRFGASQATSRPATSADLPERC